MSTILNAFKNPLIKKYLNFAIKSGIAPLTAIQYVQNQLSSEERKRLESGQHLRPDEAAELSKSQKRERPARIATGLATAGATLALPGAIGKLAQLFGLGDQQEEPATEQPAQQAAMPSPEQSTIQQAERSSMRPQQQDQQQGPQLPTAEQLAAMQQGQKPQEEIKETVKETPRSFSEKIQADVQSQETGTRLPRIFHEKHPRVASFLEKLFKGGIPVQTATGMVRKARRFAKDIDRIEDEAALPFEQLIAQLLAPGSAAQAETQPPEYVMPPEAQQAPQAQPQQQPQNLQILQNLLQQYKKLRGGRG